MPRNSEPEGKNNERVQRSEDQKNIGETRALITDGKLP